MKDGSDHFDLEASRRSDSRESARGKIQRIQTSNRTRSNRDPRLYPGNRFHLAGICNDQRTREFSKKEFKVCHDASMTQEELFTIVDCGGKIKTSVFPIVFMAESVLILICVQGKMCLIL